MRPGIFDKRFRSISNYTTLKPCPLLNSSASGFRSISNYTTLKHLWRAYQETKCFRSISNYTTLKPPTEALRLTVCFRSISNYTTLKPHFLHDLKVSRPTHALIRYRVGKNIRKILYLLYHTCSLIARVNSHKSLSITRTFSHGKSLFTALSIRSTAIFLYSQCFVISLSSSFLK